MSKNLFSVFLGIASGYLPDIIFDLIINKNPKQNIISRMYWAEFSKFLSFIFILLVIFNFLPIQPAIFIISVITYLIVNFIKNLLKLII